MLQQMVYKKMACLYVCVCLSATLMLNISKTTRLRGSCPMGKVSTNRQKVPMARRLVTPSMSRDSMTSCSWRHSVQSGRIQKLRHGSTMRILKVNITIVEDLKN